MYKICINHSLILKNGATETLCLCFPYSNKYHYEEILVYKI